MVFSRNDNSDIFGRKFQWTGTHDGTEACRLLRSIQPVRVETGSGVPSASADHPDRNLPHRLAVSDFIRHRTIR